MAEEKAASDQEKKTSKRTRKPAAESAEAAPKKSSGKGGKDQPTDQEAADVTETTQAATGTPDAQSTAEARSESAAPASQTTASPAPSAAAKADDESSQMLPASQGKIGIFGGPKDRGIKPDDKLALPTGKHFTFERVRSLNPKSFYCAMRWNYHVLGKSIEEGKRWWANKKLMVTNPANQASIVVRAVDYGPPEASGLTIAVSPGAAEALGVEIGDEVEIALADPKLPVGKV